MPNPSKSDLPAGDMSSLGFRPKQVAIPSESVTEETQQTPALEESIETPEEVQEAQDAPEVTEESAEPEEAAQEPSLLEQFESLTEDQPTVSPELQEANKKIDRLEAQLQELIDRKDEAVVSKAVEEDTEIDLSSPLVQDFLEDLRRTDPEKARATEVQLLDEKFKARLEKGLAEIKQETEKDKQAQADRENKARAAQVFEAGLNRAAKLGGLESEIVQQWNQTAPEQRQHTALGKALLSDPLAAASEVGMYRLIRALSLEVRERVKNAPVGEVNESTGVRTQSRQTSVEINKQEEEKTPEQIEHEENEAFAESLLERSKRHDKLKFLLER
jgi:hypothetical protein